MESSNSGKYLLLALTLIVLGFVMILLIANWDERREVNDRLPTIAEMSEEVEDLEKSMIEMGNMLEDREVEIEVKDRLLEEKNIELAFLSEKVKDIEKDKSKNAAKVALLKAQLSAAQKRLRQAFVALESLRETKGLIYRVQIAMLETEEMPPLPVEPDVMLIEEKDGYRKYVIGQFREYDSSVEFRDLIRKIGLKDAWVVPYVDGNRVELSAAQAYGGG